MTQPDEEERNEESPIEEDISGGVSDQLEPQDPQDEADERAEEERQSRSHNRIKPKNSQELFLQAIPERSRDASVHLKMHLSGKIVFTLEPSGQKYLIDWTGDQLTCTSSDSIEAPCSIRLSENDLMKIASGDLNPQVAMLSHKVRVDGNTDHAMYVFNLIAPPTGF